MVRATLDNRKRQTRRTKGLEFFSRPENEPGRWWCARVRDGVAFFVFDKCPNEREVKCPYGKPGDLLWVRETWAHYQTVNHVRRQHGGAFDEVSDGLAAYRADGFDSIEDLRAHIRLMNGLDLQAIEIRDNAWKPSIHMPRWASRLTLRITNIRVERLQDISEEDAVDEGWPHVAAGGVGAPLRDAYPIGWFANIWIDINGSDAWAANPWVWALTFDVTRANVDDVLKREAA